MFPPARTSAVALMYPLLKMFPPITLPDDETCPEVNKFPPEILPVDETCPEVKILPLVVFPDRLKLMPVALPIFGLVNVAPSLTET
jgi:hypothetical protein